MGSKPKAKKSRIFVKEERLAYLLLLPAFLILISIALYPLANVFYTSMTDKTFASSEEVNFVGFQNYAKLLKVTMRELPPVIDESTGEAKIDGEGNIQYERSIRILPRSPQRYRELFQFGIFGKRYVVGAVDRDFITALLNTLVFTVFSVFFETLLGLGVALVVSSNFKGRGVMRGVMLVPWAIPTVVSARMWEWMLAPSRVGVLNTIFEALGIGGGYIAFLSNDSWSLPMIVAVDVWKTTPFMALILLAGLQLIPGHLYESAKIDGANSLQQFINITLPLIKPVLAVALVFRTLDALRVFDVFQVLFSQSKYSLATYNYYQLIGNRDMGLSSSIGVITFVLIFIFAVIYIKILGVDTDDGRN